MRLVGMADSTNASTAERVAAAAPRRSWSMRAATAAPEEGESAGRLECRWQRDQLPDAIRELVLDDQRLRNDICWSVFDCLECFPYAA